MVNEYHINWLSSLKNVIKIDWNSERSDTYDSYLETIENVFV